MSPSLELRRSAVTTLPICELNDPDGSYLLVQPFDEVRCRVIASNVAQKGEVLYKRAGLSWRKAAQDLGGWTRLSPSLLLASRGEAEGPDPENILGVLEDKMASLGEHQHPDPEGDPVDPESLTSSSGSDESDPRAAILRLAIHYRKAHERMDGEHHWVALCDCPDFGPGGDRIQARLHALVSMGLLANKLPTLPRIFQAIHEVQKSRERVA
jgi:hypothetical protein